MKQPMAVPGQQGGVGSDPSGGMPLGLIGQDTGRSAVNSVEFGANRNFDARLEEYNPRYPRGVGGLAGMDVETAAD